MIKNKQGGFTLIESILVMALAVGLIFVVYHFGWGTQSKAGARALETDIKTIEQAVGAYILKSNGLYPTDDGKRPATGTYKLILWDASFKSGAMTLSFYPDFVNKLPRHWNEGIWRIDFVGKVTADINPKDY